MYALIHNISFSVWLTSLCKQALGSGISVQLTQICFFLWLSNIPLYICTTFLYPFIYQWISRLLHVLAIVNSATWTLVSMCLFELWFSWGICPVVGFLGHMVVLVLVSYGISILLSIVVVSIYIPNSRTFPLLHILSSMYCLYIFCWWPSWSVWGDTSL